MKILLAILLATMLAYTGVSQAQTYGSPNYGYQQPRSGSTYDYRNGNMYNWNRDSMGTTHVYGSNIQNGTTWSQTIDPNGNQRGIDSHGNSWSYDRNTGNYINYGTGRMCTGRGAARTCF